MEVSNRVKDLQYSAIRKLGPLANKAKQAGKEVIHLNVGVPDSLTPPEFFEAISKYSVPRLVYAPSVGEPQLIQAISDYFLEYGMNYSNEEIVITSGASEALTMILYAITDPGDRILTADPYYSNYQTFIDQWGINLDTFPTYLEEAYALPEREVIEAKITEKTKAILVCNPSNPTGKVYTREEVLMLGQIAVDHNLFIIADEIYRDFIYTDQTFVSFGEFEAFERNVILLDSISKRFSACGARIGAILCKNQDLIQQFTKLCSARLASPTIDQIGATALYQKRDDYLVQVLEDYIKKRDLAYALLSEIPGVTTYQPQGAFYMMVGLPVKDTDAFCEWLLTNFSDSNQTVMLAPAAGFYHEEGRGKNEVRLAFAVSLESLERGIALLSQALEEFNQHEKQ